MKLSVEEKWALVVFVAGSIATYFVYTNLEENQKNIINLASLIGTLLSISGIVLAYLQIRKMESNIEATRKGIIQTYKKVNQVISVSKLSKGHKLIQEIQSYIRVSKYEIALVRMQDLSEIIIEELGNKDVEVILRKLKFQKLSTDLSIDINNINELLITSGKKNVDFATVSSNLQNISNALLELQNQVKLQNYGT